MQEGLQLKQHVKLSDGVVKQNLVLMSGLFAAPVVAIADTLTNALVLCMAFTLITLLSVTVCSFLPRKIVFAVRIVIYAVVSAVIYVPVMFLLNLIFGTSVIAQVGVYLPIIITNPLIMSKTESRFYLRPFKYMLKDLVAFIIGFDLSCLVIGVLRDILVYNQLGAFRVSLPFQVPALGTVYGGFIFVGILAGIFRAAYNRNKKRTADGGKK